MKKSSSKKNGSVLIFAAVAVVIVVIVAIVGMFKDSGKSQSQMDYETAKSKLSNKVKKIGVTEIAVEPEKIDVSEYLSVADELPDINKSYPLVVIGNTGSSYSNVEIFSSGEKAAKSGTDAFLTDMAEDFNKENFRTDAGTIMTVSIRSVPSGTAVEYISTGVYVPAGYSPSNELFGELLIKDGVGVTVVDDRVVGNVAGILISKSKYKEMSAKGTVTAETVFDAVVNGELSMGYSNPYTSATGINFLMTALSTLSPDDMLSENAVSKFQAFQANIPLVSYTTQQMTSSAEKGLIDALVSEYQTYANDSTLTRNFEFIPFGVRHDNPLYAIEVVENSDEDQVLKAFAEYCDQHQDLARKDGFNGMDEYTGSGAKFTGLQVSEAQTIWKEEKASGKTIVAEFIVDVSGSMSGEPINNLRAAMKNTMRYISDEHYIGVLAFDDDVYEYLPIDKFTLEQKTLYNGAVNSLTAAGSTGMYDAILVGVDKVIKKCDELGSNATPIIFVLTDGETNSGNNYSDVKSILDGLDIPIYSISYNYSNDELGKLSNLNEASYINGDSENIVYKLKNLFNVEM